MEHALGKRRLIGPKTRSDGIRGGDNNGSGPALQMIQRVQNREHRAAASTSREFPALHQG
ncbi:hypothetical protein D9D10_01455 [Raoultella ornithinolytica]|nr:hypothetical protein EFT36_12945 [Raoultella ornithinolytica]KIZ39432.1 hypothetical protein OO18_26340 [Raoultella ornithinolytica]RLP21288.1 hypothetical protein D9D10_01455 [Raoultella ornithinolytica]HCJ04812.1 hypothetical protein [Raoultella ornithinolytica]